MAKGIKILLIIIMIATVVTLILGIDIKLFGKRAIPERSDCIIVLGCSVYGTTPSPFLAGRLQHAELLYRQGYANYIIVSGGQGAGELISEAEAMKNYLIERGIDSDRIIIENRSTSTYENLAYSKEKMVEFALSDAIIVSNKFHLRRASYIAKKLEIPSTYSGVYLEAHKYSERSGFLREIPALIFTIIKLFLK